MRNELKIFAMTIPHHTPVSPPLRMIAKSMMKKMVKTRVRKMVAINALNPFLIPW